MNNEDENTYGFLKHYDNKLDYPSKKVTEDLAKSVFTKLLLFIFVIVNLFFIFLAGYIAWNSYINDPKWLKLSKTILSTTFYPFFLAFIFLKFIVFQLP